MVIKIIRKWYDKTKRYQYGQDSNGELYCRDLRENRNLVLVDKCFKQKNNYYYKFVDPVTKKTKMVKR